jgi:hypothetical protein
LDFASLCDFVSEIPCGDLTKRRRCLLKEPFNRLSPAANFSFENDVVIHSLWLTDKPRFVHLQPTKQNISRQNILASQSSCHSFFWV